MIKIKKVKSISLINIDILVEVEDVSFFDDMLPEDATIAAFDDGEHLYLLQENMVFRWSK